MDPRSPRPSIYALLDERFCLWDVDIQQRNLAFLRGIDAEYFDYVVESNLDGLERDESKLRAAAALRMAYFNGIETLFLLLGGSLQAPDCVYAWVAQCTNGQLRELLRRVATGDSTLPLKVTLDTLSWGRMARAVHVYSDEDSSRATRNGELFGQLWDRLAAEYLSDRNIKEYNSLKHGFRVRHGGASLSAGVEHEYGVSPPAEEMKLVGSSEFGTSFYTLEQVGGNERSNRSRRTRQVSANWSAEGIALCLQLIAMSIRNVLSHLEMLNGAKPFDVRFFRPSDDDDFDLPWRNCPSLLNLTFDFVLRDEESMKTTKEQLDEAWLKSLDQGA